MTAEAARTQTYGNGRRPDVEKELDEKYHVKWHFSEGVSTDKFNKERSLHNQARFEPIDQETVESYTEGVKRGDIFPAVLAYRPTARAHFVTIDGNHRLVAHEEAGVPIDVYEIDRDTDPKTIALMTFAFNTRHGRPTTEAERVEQALYLVDNGASTNAAAAAVNISPRLVTKAISRAKADARADDVGIKRPEWDALNVTVKNRLLNISTDEGFRAAAQLAFTAALDANEVFDLAATLNTSKSGVKQVKVVAATRDAMRERIQANAGGVLSTADRRGMTPRGRVGMMLGHVINLPEDYSALVKAYADGERAEAAAKVRAAAERLTLLADALSLPKGKR